MGYLEARTIDHLRSLMLNFNLIEVIATALFSMWLTTSSQLGSFKRIEKTTEQVKTELMAEMRGEMQAVHQALLEKQINHNQIQTEKTLHDQHKEIEQAVEKTIERHLKPKNN